MRNRCTFFAVAITLAANLSAFAADMPVKAPVYKAPPAAVVASIWTGFYAGLNAGAVWGRNDTSTINGPSKRITDDALALAILAGAGTDRGVGFIGGGQVGYNWQLTPTWVAGLEADIQGLTLKQDRTSPVATTGSNSAQDFDRIKHEWLATFRARLGYAWAQSLLYVTGGAAVGGTTFSRTGTWDFADVCPIDGRNGFVACHVGSIEKTRWGPVVGVGWEYAFAGRWSAKIEYLHVWLPGVMLVTTNPASRGMQQLTHIASTSNIDLVRVGLNYQFH